MNLTIGLMAGLASALLIEAASQGGFVALTLFLLSPLPILIVALGWSHWAGLAGAASGALALTLIDGPLAAFVFAGGTALPAWALAYLALLGRTHQNGQVEWFPAGLLLQAIPFIAASVFIVTSVAALGTIEAFRAHAQEVAELFVRLNTGTAKDAPLPQIGGIEGQVLAENFAAAMPFLAAQGLTLIYAFYLWSAGRIVQMSGRLPRPWPDLPSLSMSRSALVACLAGGVMAYFLPGFLAVGGLALAGGMMMAFCLQGLAFVHDISRGNPFRFALLLGLYLILMVTQGLAFFVLFLVGVADTALKLRQRASMQAPPGPRIS